MKLFFETFLRTTHGDAAVDAYIAKLTADTLAEAEERERVAMEQWRIAEQTGTLHKLLPPDEL